MKPDPLGCCCSAMSCPLRVRIARASSVKKRTDSHSPFVQVNRTLRTAGVGSVGGAGVGLVQAMALQAATRAMARVFMVR